jgi:hypothetical protein
MRSQVLLIVHLHKRRTGDARALGGAGQQGQLAAGATRTHLDGHSAVRGRRVRHLQMGSASISGPVAAHRHGPGTCKTVDTVILICRTLHDAILCERGIWRTKAAHQHWRAAEVCTYRHYGLNYTIDLYCGLKFRHAVGFLICAVGLLIMQLYKAQQFRCYRSGLRRLLGEYGGIEADKQTNSSRQQAAADS